MHLLELLAGDGPYPTNAYVCYYSCLDEDNESSLCHYDLSQSQPGTPAAAAEDPAIPFQEEVLSLADDAFFLPPLSIPPEPRRGAALVQSSETEILLFGGVDSYGSYQTDLYLFRLGHAWYHIPLSSVQKTPQRMHFAYAAYNRFGFLWGGYGPDGLYNDLYCLDFESFTWTAEYQSVLKPSPRAQVAFDSNEHFLYLYGGLTAAGPSAELWRFDLETKQWVILPQSLLFPSYRIGAQMFIMHPYIYILGGRKSATASCDSTLWRANIEMSESDANTTVEWETVETVGLDGNPTSFTPRYEAGMFYNLAFGGKTMDSDGNPVHVKSYLLFYPTDASDPPTSMVLVEKPISLEVSECGFTLCPLSDGSHSGFAFGGYVNGKLSGAFYQFPLDQGSEGSGESAQSDQSQRDALLRVSEPVPNIPSARTGHQAVAVFDSMWVFGGMGHGQSTRFTAESMFVFFNDLHAFSLTSQTWERVRPLSETLPPGRAHFGMAEYASSLVVFGGDSYDESTGGTRKMNDLWMYSILDNTWTLASPRPFLGQSTIQLPPPSSHPAVVVYQRSLFVFGGLLESGNLSAELWSFSFVTHCWTQWTPATNAAALPPRQGAHLFIRAVRAADGSSRDQLVMAGGTNEDGLPENVIYFIDLSSSSSDADRVVYTASSSSFSSSSALHSHVFLQDSYLLWTGHGILSIGGLQSGASQNLLAYTDCSTDPPSVLLESEDKLEFYTAQIFTDLGIAGSAVLYGRTVYIFGGRSLFGYFPSELALQNTLIALPLNSLFFACSPGTYDSEGSTSSDTSSSSHNSDEGSYNDGCTPTPPSSYSSSYGTTFITTAFCPPGTHTPGAASLSQCHPCNTSTYSPAIGSECIA